MSCFEGPGQVDILDRKLTESKVGNLGSFQIQQDWLFPAPPPPWKRYFTDLSREISQWPTVLFTCLGPLLAVYFSQDEVEFIFITLLLLFCPASLDLIQRQSVENIQQEFGILLQKYLNKK